MERPLLEVIALSGRDGAAAQAGGADRLEVAAETDRDHLTPSPATIASIKAECSLPLRVMLRSNGGFGATPAELEALAAAAASMSDADGFVFGFLGPGREIDVTATSLLAAVVGARPWTFHRAVDHAGDPARAWDVVRRLPGLSAVLTAGSPQGVEAGMERLRARAMSGDAGIMLVGGGLRREHLPRLMSYGVRCFHVGSAVRAEGWDGPVDRRLVAEWRNTLDSA